MLTEIWILKGPRKSSWHSFLSNGLPKSNNLICYDIFLEKKNERTPLNTLLACWEAPWNKLIIWGGLSTCKLRAERGPEAASKSVSEPPNTQIACWEGSGGGPESRLWASQHAKCVLRGVRLQSLALLSTSLSNLLLVAPWQTICISLHSMWQNIAGTVAVGERMRQWIDMWHMMFWNHMTAHCSSPANKSLL